MRRIKVNIYEDQCGYVMAWPVSHKIRTIIKNYMMTWNVELDAQASAFIEHDSIEHFIPKRKREDIKIGYTITVLVDAWEFLHLYGWDAHTLSERGEI